MMVVVMLLVGMVTVSAAHFHPWGRTPKLMFLRMLGFRIHHKSIESPWSARRRTRIQKISSNLVFQKLRLILRLVDPECFSLSDKLRECNICKQGSWEWNVGRQCATQIAEPNQPKDLQSQSTIDLWRERTKDSKGRRDA
jgi:hypothetical protein